MIIFVPAAIQADLIAAAANLETLAGVRMLPYDEDSLPTEGVDEAEAVFRWIAGKRYADIVERGAKLRWLHTASAGVDHVLTAPVRAKTGLVVTDSGDAFAIAIGEFVLAWMLMIARCLPNLLEHQRAHRWESVQQEELWGQNVGIIGLGPIGLGIAARCKAMGMQTIGLRRRPAPAENVDSVLTGDEGLNTLLAESDWVVIAAALTGETRALIGADALARMKPTARIINIARGGLIDQNALIAALQAKTIAGACLDVFSPEPLDPASPLWDLPGVYIAPHNSSGWTAGLRERQQQIFLDNLQRFVRNEPLTGVVDMERGY